MKASCTKQHFLVVLFIIKTSSLNLESVSPVPFALLYFAKCTWFGFFHAPPLPERFCCPEHLEQLHPMQPEELKHKKNGRHKSNLNPFSFYQILTLEFRKKSWLRRSKDDQVKPGFVRNFIPLQLRLSEHISKRFSTKTLLIKTYTESVTKPSVNFSSWTF